MRKKAKYSNDFQLSYGLCWEKHLDAEKEKGQNYYLKRIKKRELTGESPGMDNFLFEGDNYPVLKALLPIYKEKVQVIYIDPPYNTGKANQWIYNDHFKEKNHAWRHSKWLNFMEKRLRLAREFLSPEGVLMVSIDDNELAQLRLLLDQIFGEEHFVNTLLVKRATKNLNNQFKKVASLNQAFEYVLVYRKSDAFYYKNAFRESSDKRKSGYWTSFYNNADRPTMRYEIEGIGLEKGQWKWEKNRAFRALENYKLYLEKYSRKYDLKSYWLKFKDAYEENTGFRLEFLRRHKNNIQYWVLPKEKTLMDTNLTDFYINDNYGKSRYGFDTVKNLKFIKKLISMVSSGDELIMDFFAGSGTTGHAVWSLNREDGGKRKFILITNNENQIAERICYPRLKTVYEINRQEGLQYFKLQHFKPGKKYSFQTVKKAITDYVALYGNTFETVSDSADMTILTNRKKTRYNMIIWNLNATIPNMKMLENLYVFSPEKVSKKDLKNKIGSKVQTEQLPDTLIKWYRALK